MGNYIKALTLAALLLAPLSVLAHDEHEWINNGNYKSPRGEHCCGKNDCEVVPASDVREDGQYFIYIPTNERIDKKTSHVSQDDKYHRCHYRSNGIKMTRCFFYPFKGG